MVELKTISNRLYVLYYTHFKTILTENQQLLRQLVGLSVDIIPGCLWSLAVHTAAVWLIVLEQFMPVSVDDYVTS